MKKIISSSFLLLFCVFHYCVHSQETSSLGLKQISEPMIKEWVDFLASDEMRGRSSPSIEADRAADYIAMKLKEFGIQPVNSSYYQQIPFCAADLDVEKCKFILTTSGNDHNFAIKENYTPLFGTGSNQAVGNLVFAGYGITAPEYDYDDYENIDVSNKIVLVMKQEPRKNDTISTFFNGQKETRYSDIQYKIRNAKEHGALGLLLVTDPLHNVAITAQGYLWNSLYMKSNDNPIYDICEENATIPAVQVNRDVINTLFGSVDSLRTIQHNIDEEMRPLSFEIPTALVDLTVTVNKNEFPSSNVIGWLEGSDPALKNEFVVIGAHYDHVGVAPKPNHLNDSILNGADDNASGAAAVMAVAKAFSSLVKKPARSVLFILFTAEERGLIGSNYYTKHPLFPLEKTVAMINMDMVGRNGNDTVYVIGQQYNPELAALANATIPETGLKKEEMAMDLYQSSDYYPFYKNGISAIGFTSGLHIDYHNVGDNPDKINHQKVRKIAELAYKMAWQIANSNNYYSISGNR